MLPKILPEDTNGKGVIGLPDVPGLTTQDMQERFDQIALEVIVPKFNELADILSSNEGAGNIGTEDGSTVEQTISDLSTNKADISNVLTKDQAEEYTPTGEYNPATKKYVDEKVLEVGAADMAKAVYDKNDNGIVDNSERLGGQMPEYYGLAPVRYTATLKADSWNGSAAPYTQTVSVPGILETDYPHIAPVFSSDNATAIQQREGWAAVGNAVSENNMILFTCFEEKPVVEIPIQIEVLR